METLLFALNLSAFAFFVFCLAWRRMVEARLRGVIKGASEKVKNASNERTQIQSFMEQQRINLQNLEMELGRLEKRLVVLRQEIMQARNSTFQIVHISGDPSREKKEYHLLLTPNPSSKVERHMSECLRKCEHSAVMWVEDDTAAKRLSEVWFHPEKGALRGASQIVRVDK